MKSNYYILSKDKLTGFLKAAARDYGLVAPQSAEGGDFLFQETEDLDKINLNYDTTYNSLKEFFFPAREIIFRYERKPGSSFKIIPCQDKIKPQTIFFGLRSCDVRAVNFQDAFFAQEPRDALYWQKRERAILVSFACNKPPRKSCFCVFTKGGPFLEKDEGFDLQVIDAVKKYLVEAGTKKGEDLINQYRKFFTKAGYNDIQKKSLLKDDCANEFVQKYNLLSIYAKLKHEDLSSLWEELGKRCTNCGGCEFICPTCFCFYTQDIEYSPHRGARIRGWDSCTFSGYSRMAGEVNPHERNSDRISRRFYCKLYNCYNWFKLFACTGCGRCSFVCPVNLDMESFLASLTPANKYQPLLKEL